LSNAPAGGIDLLLREPLRAFTSQTTTSMTKLKKRVCAIERGEFGYDREEYEEGVCAIALPIPTPGSENYAVAVSMPSKRFAERLPQLRESLRKAQRGIESALGTI
jgi:DNA-binding IclR family transcriptional regulator